MKLNIQLGRSTKILGNIKLPPPLNLKFLWGKQQKGTRDYIKKNAKPPEIPMGKTKTVLGNIKLPPPLNFRFNWEDQQRY